MIDFGNLNDACEPTPSLASTEPYEPAKAVIDPLSFIFRMTL